MNENFHLIEFISLLINVAKFSKAIKIFYLHKELKNVLIN